MCVGKQHGLVRQLIDIWRLGLRVPTQHTDPVVQVIDRDHQDVEVLAELHW